MKMDHLPRRLAHCVLFIFGDGGWALKPIERQIVEAAVRSLADDLQALINLQLDQPLFIERTNNRVSVLRHYAAEPQCKLPGSEWDDAVTNVYIEVEQAKQIAQVTFYSGYLFTVEMKKPRRFYSGRPVKVLAVKPGNSKRTYTRIIDRSEHPGSWDDDAA
jgi:hypothetical protein